MHNQPRHTDDFSPLRSKKATGALSVMFQGGFSALQDE
jgi:hypothetical protein